MYKTCTECKLEKTFDEFYKEKNGRFGLKGKCKVCYEARKPSRALPAEEKERRWWMKWGWHIGQPTFKCRSCFCEKVWNEYPPNEDNVLGFRYSCRQCVNARYNKNYNMPGIMRENILARVKEKAQRLRKHIPYLYELAEGWCAWCDKIVDNLNEIEVDHIYPQTPARNEGWPEELIDDVRNLRVLHKWCNGSKSDKITDEALRVKKQLLGEVA